MGSIFVKLILMISVFSLFVFFLNKILRKWLNVEKKKPFSYDHVNAKHKKIDWTIRIASIVLLLIGYSVNITRVPTERIWFLETYFILFAFLIVSETVELLWKNDMLKMGIIIFSRLFKW
ncbi:hypothetical protein HMPREF9372_0088 [Sporosarcina newyorkensis 2681]|uniref:Uncharacterized protein n=1 Tax=Sporosarcina newyorkensis 2681 TaxID=1027292 RepID=F9DMQ8_9BACL|nr:hypothetical protein HMPREF9372_0088 [Sporosarcina newyorkensis 2681]